MTNHKRTEGGLSSKVKKPLTVIFIAYKMLNTRNEKIWALNKHVCRDVQIFVLQNRQDTCNKYWSFGC